MSIDILAGIMEFLRTHLSAGGVSFEPPWLRIKNAPIPTIVTIVATSNSDHVFLLDYCLLAAGG